MRRGASLTLRGSGVFAPRLREIVHSGGVAASDGGWDMTRQPNHTYAQRVSIHAKLSNYDLDTLSNLQLIRWIQDQLRAVLKAASVGICDGHVLGEGMVQIDFYGPDADALWDAMRSKLREIRTLCEVVAIKRYGARGAREVKVSLDDFSGDAR